MKKVTASFDEKENLYITTYGVETDWQKAHWGRGSRNQTIIHYVLSGEGYFNGVKIKKGEGFFLPRKKIHEYHSSKANPWTYFFIVLNGKESDDFFKKYVSCDENGVFKYDFSDKLSNFADEILINEGMISQIRAMGFFLLILSFHEEKNTAGKKANKYVEETKKYIKNNLHKKISIKEIADLLYISDRYLYNLFVDYEGISPKQYLDNKRLKYAIKFLDEGRMNVTEIANSLGFSDLFAFSRFFNKRMGVSPKNYKNKVK